MYIKQMLYDLEVQKHCDHNILMNKISINRMSINQVWSAKFLGVYSDKHLTWSDHIETVKGKVSKTRGLSFTSVYFLKYL